jgi:hypothetical protein
MRLHPRVLAAAVSLLAACSALQPTARVHGGAGGHEPRSALGPSAIGETPDPTLAPGLDPSRPAIHGTADRPTAPAERRVCRHGSWPSGWIAVSYVAGAGDCPKTGRDEAYPVAVIVRYSNQPTHAQLDVCMDQSVPAGWVEEHGAEGSGDQCPGAAASGGGTTKRIRRIG